MDFDGINSEFLETKTGVPQGSILGPLLFIIYMNDVSYASNLFNFILYADDTTLSTTLNVNSSIDDVTETINRELQKICVWLQVNELSLNVDKSKLMIFHHSNKKVNKPHLLMNDIPITQVSSFNFLGLTIDEKLSWNEHITKISTKISRVIGILNKLKHQLPLNVKITMYNSLILPHINFGILLWGFKLSKIDKLQKKAVRCISCSKYNAHSEPILKTLKLLKIQDIFTTAKLKFYYKYIHNDLPTRLLSFQFIPLNELNDYNTSQCDKLFINRVNKVIAKQSLIFDIPIVVNQTDSNIIEKIHTHSLQGFTFYIKNNFLNNYQYSCNRNNCYVCQNNQ